MKILLDECLPIDLRHHFSNHETHTAEWAGFKGKKNGDLLGAAESSGYEVLLTMDQALPHQQYFVGRRLSLILLRSQTNQMRDLVPLVGAIDKELKTIQPGQTVVITASDVGR